MAEAENLDQSADQNNSEASKGETVTSERKATETKTEGNVVWPEDWRKRFAGDDEKLLKRAARFNTPEDIWKSFLEADKKISEGVKLPTITDKSTPEEVKAYRELMGVPEAWTDYKTDVNGLVWGEGDKDRVDSFLEHAHKGNIPQPMVSKVLEWYGDLIEAETAEMETADFEERTNNTVQLKQEWGGEYDANLNAIKGLFDGKGEGILDTIFQARVDGKLLGNNPDVLKALASIAREINPHVTLMGGTSTSMQSIDDEINSIQKDMQTVAYRKGGAASDKKFARLTELLTAKEKLQS